MAHNEHNKSRRSGSYFLIILGAILLMIAPTIHPNNPELGIMSLVGGFIVGGAGFYKKFLKKK